MDEQNEQSVKGALSHEDVKRWIKNTFIFVTPVLLIYLTSVQMALQDGFAWSDFGITVLVQGSIATWAVSTLLDLFRKMATGPKIEE